MSNTLHERTPLTHDAVGLVAEAMRAAGVRTAAPGHERGAAILYFGGPGEDVEPGALTFRLLSGEVDPGADARRVVWVVRRATAARLRDLRAQRQSFVDVATGAMHIRQPGLVIDRRGGKRPLVGARARARGRTINPFADRASRVARRLCAEPHRTWGVRELALAAEVSPMIASGAIRRLQTLGVVEVDQTVSQAAIRLTSIRRMIEAWASAYDWERNPSCTFSAPVGDPMRFLRRSASWLASRRSAVTMQAGASLVAPLAAWDKLHIYVEAESASALESVGREAGWTPSPDGRVVLLRPYYKHALWDDVQERDGIRVVSPLQLIVDLWWYPVRGREQAEHLLTRLEKESP